MASHDRETAWQTATREHFDLVVVGGGVLGAATARDAALRGLRVALVEADDIASGTSSRSSKLIHGGFRYLEQGELSLVFESVSERQVLLKIAPHLVRPLGFLFPIYDNGPVGLRTLQLGLFVYEGLALFRSPKRYQTLSTEQVANEIPGLRQEGLRGAPLFWDCATDDARITLENVIDARRAGAVVLTHTRVTEMIREDERLQRVRIVDTLDPNPEARHGEIRANVVVNATGPWSDRTRAMAGREGQTLRLTKGVHIVVPADRVPVPHTIVAVHPADSRVLFIIPWGDQVYVGTTDTDYDGDPADVRADAADVGYLLDAINAYLPSANVQSHEITATWAGLRALIHEEGVPPSQVSREHVISVDPDGLISIAGGKLTTHRRMGKEVVDNAVAHLKRARLPHPELKRVHTEDLPLPGADGWPEGDDGSHMAARLEALVQGRLAAESCRYLANRYGSQAIPLVQLGLDDERLFKPLVEGRPEILAQVDWAVQEEVAVTVTDFMERRTQLFFRDHDQGLGAVALVSGRMAELIGWSDAERAAYEQDYRDRVASSRAWKHQASDADASEAGGQGVLTTS